MPKPPKLTEAQRNRLAMLEPALKRAAKLGKYEEAKRLASDVQAVLRPTGHETRLMEAKNWLFQAAMEDGRLQLATAGFNGVRQKVASSTRIYLEATALLAICYLRQRNYAAAEPLMAEALASDANITSHSRRFQFRRRLIERFEEETLLFALQGDTPLQLNPDEVQAAAIAAIQSKTEDEMLADVGKAIPEPAVQALLRVHEFARRQLEPQHRLALPPAQSLASKSSLGKKVVEASKRVVWRTCCDPESDLYKAWYTNGVSTVLNGNVFGASIVAALGGFRLGTYTLVVAITAFILKMGLEVFCEVWTPNGIMIGRGEKS